MENFIFFDNKTRQKHLRPRQGETKLGEQLSLLTSLDQLEHCSASYIIIGVPEDIGIQANFGQPGAATTWNSFLDSFLNIQSNRYNLPESCVILGHINCKPWMETTKELMATQQEPQKQLGPLVEKIDQVLTQLISAVVKAGKIPIVIGGGHNNAYPNIKGTSQALQQPISVLNVDAHTDLRHADYRHSGNGFTYARQEGFLKEYTLFGIHKNYTPEYIFEKYDHDPHTKFIMFEDLISLSQKELLAEFAVAANFKSGKFGLEIDCDAIEDFKSSAMTPSGFSISDIRNFLTIAKQSDLHYVHLAEASAKDDAQIGKALTYFVSDLIQKQ